MRTLLLFVIGMAFIAGCSTSQKTMRETECGDLPVYYCVYVAQGPKVDGKLDDAVWQRLTGMPLVLADSGEPPAQPTVLRTLWTDKALFVAFECTDRDIWAATTEHDGDIYQEEVVEVFIDANRDGKTYYELEVSPTNNVLDLYILNPGPGEPFIGMRDFETGGMVTAVAVDGTFAAQAAAQGDDKGWTVEIMIPFEALPLAPNQPPKDRDCWRCNFYRIDRPVEGNGEYSAWSRTVEVNYHRPDRFGCLVFCKGE